MWNNNELRECLDDFLDVYSRRPIDQNHGGGLSVNNFYVYFALNKLQPKYVLESGVFQGLGTWLIEQTVPGVKLVCIDPLLHQVVYKSNNAKYITNDFLSFTNDNISRDRARDTLIYFDDHQNQFERIKHAHMLGFKHLIWDDNYPEYKGQRHLSLQACINKLSDPGYNIPFEASSVLSDVLDEYYIFPPVLQYTEPVSMEKSYIDGTPILDTWDEKYQVFDDDMHNYRWTTYTKLK